MSKFYGIIPQCPVPPKNKPMPIPAKDSLKREIKLPLQCTSPPPKYSAHGRSRAWKEAFNHNSCKNQESRKQPFQIYFPVKLADERMSIKRKNFVPTSQYCRLQEDSRKSRTFCIKDSLKMNCRQIFRKYIYRENLLLS